VSRRSIRKRRHRLEGVSAQFIIIDEAADFEFERVTIGGVDVTEMVSSVSYREHRKRVEHRAAISLGLAFPKGYVYRFPEPHAATLARYTFRPDPPLVVGIDPGSGESKTVIARRHADGRLELEELP
jgi:hypothetical protein